MNVVTSGVLCAASTKDLLTEVNGTNGAIGIAETSAVNGFPNVVREQINQVEPAPNTIGTGTRQYPFWTVEYFYTYGTPTLGSPAAAFLAFLNTTDATKMIRDNGSLPCAIGEPDANSLCTVQR
jgi:ABC-type phosphate transport system substrate-binding protein